MSFVKPIPVVTLYSLRLVTIVPESRVQVDVPAPRLWTRWSRPVRRNPIVMSLPVKAVVLSLRQLTEVLLEVTVEW